MLLLRIRRWRYRWKPRLLDKYGAKNVDDLWVQILYQNGASHGVNDLLDTDPVGVPSFQVPIREDGTLATIFV